MGMSKAQKEAEVQELNQRFANDELVVVTHYSGLTVAELSELRANLRKLGATFKVTKNSLARRAIKGTRFEKLDNMFTGPTGVATSQDPIAAAKAAYEFAAGHEKLIILGGAFGDMILDKAGVEQIAKLPNLDEIRSKLVGLLQAPAVKMAGVLQAPARQMVGVTAAYGAKGE